MTWTGNDHATGLSRLSQLFLKQPSTAWHIEWMPAGGCLLARDVWYFLSDRGSLTVRRIADQLSSSTHGGWRHSAALNS